MAKHLEDVIGQVKHIKLETDTVSVYSRTQTEPGRICTVEAIALLLQELGENDAVCRSLIAYILVNNQALRPNKIKSSLYETGPGKFHPAWYFHHELITPQERWEQEQGKEKGTNFRGGSDASSSCPSSSAAIAGGAMEDEEEEEETGKERQVKRARKN